MPEVLLEAVRERAVDVWRYVLRLLRRVAERQCAPDTRPPLVDDVALDYCDAWHFRIRAAERDEAVAVNALHDNVVALERGNVRLALLHEEIAVLELMAECGEPACLLVEGDARGNRQNYRYHHPNLVAPYPTTSRLHAAVKPHSGPLNLALSFHIRRAPPRPA